MPSLLRRLHRFVYGLLTAIMRALGREPLVAPEPAPPPIRRTVLDTMTPADHRRLDEGLHLHAALTCVAGRTTGRLVLLDSRDA